MASAVFFVNQKGDEVMARHYRGDVTKASMDAFRHKVMTNAYVNSHIM